MCFSGGNAPTVRTDCPLLTSSPAGENAVNPRGSAASTDSRLEMTAGDSRRPLRMVREGCKEVDRIARDLDLGLTVASSPT
jgi:hypothetical protein